MHHRLGLFLVASFALAACSEGQPAVGERDAPARVSLGSDAAIPLQPDAAQAEGCAWGVDTLLAKAGLSAPGRVNCGMFWSTESPLPGASCFEEQLLGGSDAEFTYNACDDCLAPTTYVGLRSGERVAVRMEEDGFGDALREAKVELCEQITAHETERVSCAFGRELYRCTEPLAMARAKPAPLPVTPRKLTDSIASSGPTTTLHLYVSNQSFERPLVDIDIFFNDEHVVIGDFDVAGQHNWLLFDLVVPTGPLQLYARSLRGRASLRGEPFEIAGERWAVLEYWFDPTPRFTVRLSDRPVAFD